MKPYLLIRNKGLAPIESFTVLGLSTARGGADKIGQFGSGSKHGILTLLRHGIIPRIFIGDDELCFTTHPAKMAEKDYKEVRYTFRGETHKTGMCLEFGALDWDKPEMALREFICNALDQGEVIHQCALEEDGPLRVADETRIYVPTENPAVRGYFERIQDYFLHFHGLQDKPIIPARCHEAQFFRRGVFVTARSKEGAPALFAYNFQTSRIDESRNMDGAAMGSIAGDLIEADQDALQIIFASFAGESKWEHSIGDCVMPWLESVRKRTKAAWQHCYGSLPFSRSVQVCEALSKKGIAFVAVPHSWGGTLKMADVVDGETLLTELDQSRSDECEATETAIETFRRCWRWIEAARLTGGKPFPTVKCFSQPMHEGAERHGYYYKGTVYLNLDFDSNEQCALEELSHYITGARDETRDFQDFAFKLATRLAKLRTP